VGSAAAVAPTIVSSGVSAVASTAAVLEAEINPEGEATTYHFEYGLADCSANPCTSAPSPNGNVGSGSSAVKVTRQIEGLSPDTKYHFRVVATNGSGPSAGPDRTFKTYAASAPDTSCPNQAFRIGPGANLPDCRAYEMVSPVDKNGGDILTQEKLNGDPGRTAYDQSATSGDKLTYSSGASFGDEPSSRFSNQYMATRGALGWSSHGIDAPRGTTALLPYPVSTYDLSAQFRAFTPDLSSGWITDDNLVPLTPDALASFTDLYRRDNTTGSFEAITVGAPTSFPGPDLTLEFRGYSDDLSHQVYNAAAALTPDAAANENRQIYDFSDGELHLVSVLPNGEADPQPSIVGGPTSSLFSIADYDNALADRAVSDDGSRIFWTANPSYGGGRIYVRVDGQTTIPVSESVTAKPAPGSEPAQFLTASTDGSKAVFEVRGGPLAGNLYEFDVDTETPTLIAGKVGNTHETGGVVGASDDLSYLYFVSTEALAAGATAGAPNLYLDHEGTMTFIAALSPTDNGEVMEGNGPSAAAINPHERSSRVTPDGRHLAFTSTESLTGYDNTDAVGASPKSANGNADIEVFLYDADSNHLACASCKPSGTRPVGDALRLPYGAHARDRHNFVNNEELWAAAWIPTWEHELYDSHVLSDDGSRLFFNSFDALVPEDTNGIQDVYEWEAQGTGSCDEAAGCISLISTGKGADLSEFVDATPGGDDVFIETNSSLDPRDPGLFDIYDARVGGGFPAPTAQKACLGDTCQSVPGPPNDPTPASASFRGAGNPPAARSHRRCRARVHHAGKRSHRAKEHQRAKPCRRAKGRAGR